MVRDGYKTKHVKTKSYKNPMKARNRKVMREVSRTYVFFQ